jgi:hypothetical protein
MNSGDLIMCEADINPYKDRYYYRDYKYSGWNRRYDFCATEDAPIAGGGLYSIDFILYADNLFKISNP